MTECMNAENLTLRWSEQSKGATIPVTFDGRFLSSRIGVRLREQRCPTCNSVVYSRRHTRCGVCEQVLPESFLFTRAEVEKVDTLLRTERQLHRAWLSRVESVGV